MWRREEDHCGVPLEELVAKSSDLRNESKVKTEDNRPFEFHNAEHE